MKVVCLDNTRGNTRYLEVNKVYNTIEPKQGEKSVKGKIILGKSLIGEHYIIDFNQWTTSLRAQDYKKDLFFETIWVSRKDMITLDQWRQLQLDKLEI